MTFNLAGTAPLGWTASFGAASSVSLSSGESASATLNVTVWPAATRGTSYNISATATNSAYTAYTGSAIATAAISFCVLANPIVNIIPASRTVMPGGSVNYTATVINRNSSVCPAASFNLTKTVPSGWIGSLSSTSVNSLPSASISSPITLRVTSPATAIAGNYTVSVTATNSEGTFYTGSMSATASVPSIVQDPPGGGRLKQKNGTTTGTTSFTAQ